MGDQLERVLVPEPAATFDGFGVGALAEGRP